MSRGLARREARESWRLAREAATDTASAADSLVFWLGRLRGALVCFLAGRHRWGAWGDSASIFVPPERSRCSRCGAVRYRGQAPTFSIVVEGGSLTRDEVVGQ